MAYNFAGKTVLITGASSGIGAALAVEFGKLNANLVLNARSLDKLEEAKKLCIENGAKDTSIALVTGDITEETIQKKFIETAVETFGGMDVLINNAGMTDAPLNSPLTLKMSHFDEILNLNLRAPVALSLMAVHHLRKTKGNIVNISSLAALRPILFRIGYNTTKAGLDMFTKTFAYNVAKYGVRVNSVNPGIIPTNFGRGGYRPDANKEKVKLKIKNAISVLHPLGRLGTLQEVVEAVLFLASDKASFTTGQILFVDGGAATGGIGIGIPSMSQNRTEITPSKL